MEKTTISGHRYWGIHLKNTQRAAVPTVRLQNVVLKDGGYGVYAGLPAGAKVSLIDTELSGHSGDGARTETASLLLNRVSITRNRIGLQQVGGPLLIENSTVSQNRRAGINCQGSRSPGTTSLIARWNRVSGNPQGIVAWNIDAASVINNLVTKNTYGLMLRITSDKAAVWNNTLVDNTVGVYHYSGRAIVRNNVIASGDGTNVVRGTGVYKARKAILDHGSNLVFGQSRLYSGTAAAAGDINRSPYFADYAKGDYPLSADSPAINAGTPTNGLVTRDLMGLQRPLYGAIEIGAYEFPQDSGSYQIVEWAEQVIPPTGLVKSLGTAARTVVDDLIKRNSGNLPTP